MFIKRGEGKVKYKILSLDGGGCWCILQVAALESIYGDIEGHQLLNHFNLVVANSGGSLVAACLFNNLKLSEIRNLIGNQETRKSIFKKIMFNPLGFSGLVPKYNTAEKYNALKSILITTGKKIGNLNLNNLKDTFSGKLKCPDLLIIGFDYDRERSVFFRSNTNSKTGSLFNPKKPPTITEAIHASSTAPISYFDEPAVFESADYSGNRFWDGAVAGYNNPLMAGITEAVGNGVKPNNIFALSIGTGNTCLPSAGNGDPDVMVEKLDGGFIGKNNIKKMAKSITYDPPDAATFIAHVMTGGKLPDKKNPNVTKSNIVRMNALIRPFSESGSWQPPTGLNANEFKKLVKLELDAVEKEDFDMVLTLGNLWINKDLEINQPIRMNSKLECEIGFDRFSEAKQKAQELFRTGGGS